MIRSTLLAATAAFAFAAPAFAQDADIVDTAVAAGSFETLVAAVQAADLVDTLKGEGPFTVFAPTDEAFAALPEGTVESLLLPENKEQLAAILTYHVIPGKVMSTDIAGQELSVATVNGQEVAIVATDGAAERASVRSAANDATTEYETTGGTNPCFADISSRPP